MYDVSEDHLKPPTLKLILLILLDFLDGLGGGSMVINIQPPVENFTYHRMDLFDKITPLLKLESYRPEYRN